MRTWRRIRTFPVTALLGDTTHGHRSISQMERLTLTTRSMLMKPHMPQSHPAAMLHRTFSQLKRPQHVRHQARSKLALSPLSHLGLTSSILGSSEDGVAHLQCQKINQTQMRTLFTIKKSKRRRINRINREKRREKKLLTQDWVIEKGDSVFVLREDYVLENEEVLVSDTLSPDDSSPSTLDATLLGGDLSDLGEVGVVEEVFPLRSCAVVTGVNEQSISQYDVYTSAQTEEVKPQPVSYDRLFLIDPVDNLPTITKYMYDQNTGEKLRVSRRTNEIIPWPRKEQWEPGETFKVSVDLVTPLEAVMENTRDTDKTFDLEEANKQLDKAYLERKKQYRIQKQQDREEEEELLKNQTEQ